MITPEKLDQEVVDILLPLLENEFKHFYMYRAATNWANNVGFQKAGKYFAEESEEEAGHAKKIEQYLVDWNITPSLPAITPPALQFMNLGELISEIYTNEYQLYAKYEEASAKIFEIGDLCVFDFLQEFRKIQKDAVALYSDMLNKLEGVNVSDKFQMLLLEEKLF